MLGILKGELEKLGMTYCYLDGSTKNRMDQVRRFQGDASIPAFLISLKAGGTGLNLTGADMVIHYDPWWNPAVENQATDRAYRIGQDKPVMVYRIVTTESIEERVLRLQSEKRKLVGDLALEGLAKALEKEDVMKLFELSVQAGA